MNTIKRTELNSVIFDSTGELKSASVLFESVIPARTSVSADFGQLPKEVRERYARLNTVIEACKRAYNAFAYNISHRRENDEFLFDTLRANVKGLLEVEKSHFEASKLVYPGRQSTAYRSDLPEYSDDPQTMADSFSDWIQHYSNVATFEAYEAYRSNGRVIVLTEAQTKAIQLVKDTVKKAISAIDADDRPRTMSEIIKAVTGQRDELGIPKLWTRTRPEGTKPIEGTETVEKTEGTVEPS